MKEKLYTIPLNDAVNAKDECPFCFIERKIEQDMMDFVLGSGSSYMESDVRDQTDKAGFCRMHFKKMYDYGNTLGNAWIMTTHMRETIYEMKKAMKSHTPGKSAGLFKKKGDGATNSVTAWVNARENSCFICKQFTDHYDRYMDTFFELYRKDDVFKSKINESKGFCLPHFGDLCEAAESRLKDKEQEEPGWLLRFPAVPKPKFADCFPNADAARWQSVLASCCFATALLPILSRLLQNAGNLPRIYRSCLKRHLESDSTCSRIRMPGEK